jgi:transcription termination/antitermination protein NusA
MSNEILDALGQIAREKGVDRQMLIETLEAGMASAVRKKHGETADVQVRLDSGTGQLALALRYAVVADVEDPSCQMTVDRARAFQADVAVGDYIMTPLNVAEFGRNAIQTAKQVLVQRVREAERDKVFKAYADKVGSLVRGVVQQVDRGNVIVKLDFSEGVLPAREQIPRSYHRPNEYVRAVVISVDRAAKGPQVTLSRTHPDFLRRLFENEVPEITDGIVEVKAVAREAGARSKISVHSTDPRVDAVGSCVGLKGSRVQGIVRELGGERIDIVPWSADPAVFVSRALAPARVNDVRVNELEKRMTVVVADDQLSLAIGKGGQNARLAARLTGWHIDLVSKTDEKQRHDVERASRLEVEQLGLGEATTEKLIQGGIETVQELVSTPFEKLVELPGIGEKTAEKVMTIALEFMAAYEAAMESATADMGFAPGMEPGEGASPDAAEGGPNG